MPLTRAYYERAKRSWRPAVSRALLARPAAPAQAPFGSLDIGLRHHDQAGEQPVICCCRPAAGWLVSSPARPLVGSVAHYLRRARARQVAPISAPKQSRRAVQAPSELRADIVA